MLIHLSPSTASVLSALAHQALRKAKVKERSVGYKSVVLVCCLRLMNQLAVSDFLLYPRDDDVVALVRLGGCCNDETLSSSRFPSVGESQS